MKYQLVIMCQLIIILINNHKATLISLSQVYAKSNKKEILNTFVILFSLFTSANT